MRYLWTSIYIFVASLAIYSLFFHQPKAPTPAPTPVATVAPPQVEQNSSDVEIAILLDTSASMDGLIAQARTQLWDIVAELQTDDDDEKRSVSVALYQYGNSRLDKSTDFIERLSELTPELDFVSVKLQALSTSGGKEYAPSAIIRAIDELNWSDADNVEKIIVIAGNEGFNQGPISTDQAMKKASQVGIRVVPIFCANSGATSAGLESWKRAASLAKIELGTIDPDKVVKELETPYDAQIVEKYRELQSTRLTYGDTGYLNEVETANYTADTYAYKQSVAVQASRAVAQSRQIHRQDLTVNSEAIDQLPTSQLPAELRGLSKGEQTQVIQQRKAKRAVLEKEIESLRTQRRGYQSSYPTQAGAPTLGDSVRSKLR